MKKKLIYIWIVYTTQFAAAEPQATLPISEKPLTNLTNPPFPIPILTPSPMPEIYAQPPSSGYSPRSLTRDSKNQGTIKAALDKLESSVQRYQSSVGRLESYVLQLHSANNPAQERAVLLTKRSCCCWSR